MGIEPDPLSTVMCAPEAAARLGVSVSALAVLIRHYRYEFTELAPGGRPGATGRARWG